MDFSALIENYGYLALAIGTFLEGEAVLLVAGFAAYQGHLALPKVMVVATIGSFLGDLLYFHLGRRYGPAMLARCPSAHAKAERFRGLLQRHHLPLIFSMRLLYGLRTPGLIVLGMSQVCPLRFFVLSLISALVWAVVLSLAGYGFGKTMEQLFGSMGNFDTWIPVAIVLVGLLWFIFSRRNRAAALGK